MLETPERGTAKWKAITAAKEVRSALLIALAILIIVKASGGFTLPEGPLESYFNLGIALFLILMYGLAPTLLFVAKKIAQRAKDGEDV